MVPTAANSIEKSRKSSDISGQYFFLNPGSIFWVSFRFCLPPDFNQSSTVVWDSAAPGTDRTSCRIQFSNVEEKIRYRPSISITSPRLPSTVKSCGIRTRRRVRFSRVGTFLGDSGWRLRVRRVSSVIFSLSEQCPQM